MVGDTGYKIKTKPLSFCFTVKIPPKLPIDKNNMTVL
jgi:hypothetical protein